MRATKVTRSYSKSINTKVYGIPESWIKIESVYEAEIETTDDPIKVSEMIFTQAKTEVINAVNEVVAKIRDTQKGAVTPTPAPATATPPAPANTVTTPYQPPVQSAPVRL